MENQPPPAATHEEACARVSALFGPRWLRHYGASKLRRDEVFRAAYELLRDSSEPILDVGCGVGLLPLYLRARGLKQPVTGIDVDRSKVQHARAAVVQAGYAGLGFLDHDAAGALPEFRGNIALFDVLHYLHPSAQETLLAQLAQRLAPGGMVLLRDCPQDSSARFWATYLGEVFAQAVSWNIGGPLHFPTRGMIYSAFNGNQFTLEEQPMFAGGPFNNRLFIFRRKT